MKKTYVFIEVYNTEIYLRKGSHDKQKLINYVEQNSDMSEAEYQQFIDNNGFFDRSDGYEAHIDEIPMLDNE